MIINDIDVINVSNTNDTEVIDMKLSENSEKIIFNLFTKNVYSNPIGSIVREITSNSIDSHIEANIDAPVLIKLTKDNINNDYYISFIDFGVGISPERIKNIYSVLFESNKYNTNDFIGGFGIGGKTPLAYKRFIKNTNSYDNSFFIVTYYDHIKYHYSVYENNERPSLTLLNSSETESNNGTEIIIPVLKNDISKFIYEFKKQLCYIDNIIYEGFDILSDINTNDLNNIYKNKIYKGTYFNYSTINQYSTIHAVIGNIAYPIDDNIIKSLNEHKYLLYTPIGIKFDIGEINVTVSRESIDYSNNTINIIHNKIKLAINELNDIIISNYDSIVNLYDYLVFNMHENKIKLNDNIDIELADLLNHYKFKFNNFLYKDVQIDKHLEFINKLYGKSKSNYYSYKYNYGIYNFRSAYSVINNNNNITVCYVNNIENYKTSNSKLYRQIIRYIKTKIAYYYIFNPIDFNNIHNYNYCDDNLFYNYVTDYRNIINSKSIMLSDISNDPEFIKFISVNTTKNKTATKTTKTTINNKHKNNNLSYKLIRYNNDNGLYENTSLKYLNFDTFTPNSNSIVFYSNTLDSLQLLYNLYYLNHKYNLFDNVLSYDNYTINSIHDQYLNNNNKLYFITVNNANFKLLNSLNSPYIINSDVYFNDLLKNNEVIKFYKFSKIYSNLNIYNFISPRNITSLLITPNSLFNNTTLSKFKNKYVNDYYKFIIKSINSDFILNVDRTYKTINLSKFKFDFDTTKYDKFYASFKLIYNDNIKIYNMLSFISLNDFPNRVNNDLITLLKNTLDKLIKLNK